MLSVCRLAKSFAVLSLAVVSIALGWPAWVTANDACGGENYLPDGRPAWTQGVEELTWYNAGDLEYDPAIVEGARAFEQRYGIRVKLVGIPETDYVTRAARLLATGDTTYDLFDMYTAFGMPTWAKRGWAAPVDCAVPSYLASQWPAGVWAAAGYGGKHYFVPHIIQPYLFLWNKKLFQEAGLDPTRGPASWDELVAYAKKLTRDTNGDGSIDQWGFLFPAGKIERVPILTFSYFLGMAGGRLWNEDGSAAFNGPEGVKALSFMVDLIRNAKVTPISVINYDTADVSDVFRSGGAAMVMHFQGHPTVQDIEVLGLDNIGAAPPPLATSGTNAIYPLGFVGPAVYVNAKSKHVEAAIHLAAFMGRYEQSWWEAILETNVGANTGIWDSPYLQKKYPFASVTRSIVEDSYVPTHDGLLIAMTVFKEGIDSALTGNRTPQAALDWIVQELRNRGVLR